MRQERGGLAALFQQAKEHVLTAVRENKLAMKDYFHVTPDGKFYVRVTIRVGRVNE